MKKILTTFVLFILLVINVFSQSPSVRIAIDDVAQTSFTCTFVPNSACTGFGILAAKVGEVDMYVGSFFGSTLEEVVNSWSLQCTGTTMHTWDEMEPNTEYVIYALASGGGETILYTDTLTTLPTGGSGVSVITLSVTDIGDTCATTTAVPNDQTSLFKDMIVTSLLFNEQGNSGIASMLQADQYTYYETDTWTWLSLNPGADYYFVAIGMNANGEWGELATFPFTTTGGVGIAAIAAPSFTLSPNPATDRVRISGLENNARLALVDAQGRELQCVTVYDSEMELSVSGLPAGIYFVTVRSGKGTAPAVRKLVVMR